MQAGRTCSGAGLTAIALAVLLGWSSGPVHAQSKTAAKSVDSLNTVIDEVTKARKQVQTSLTSLSALSSGGASDLTKDYKTFSKSVAAIAKGSETIKARVADMQENREAYLKEWQEKLKSIESEDIKDHMAARAEEVKAIFESSQPDREKARDAFDPFLSNLQDIDKLLSLDLSPAGVAAAAPITEKAVVNGNVVLQRIDAVLASLTKVRDQVSAKQHK